MKFFKSEDFHELRRIHGGKYQTMGEFEAMACLANEKLEKEGKIVYTMSDGPNNFLYSDEVRFKSCSKKAQAACKFKALIINIEPLKCKHPIEELLYTLITNDGPEYKLASCRLCCQKFKLQEF